MAGVGTRYFFGEGITTFTVVVVRTLTATVVGVVAGVFLLDEVPTVPIIVGAVLASAGIVGVGRGRRIRRPAKTVG
jgi:drug/metabolite transporter (DMT)-like permease